MSKRARDLNDTLSEDCGILATPEKSSTSSYNGNSTAKKYPLISLDTSLPWIRSEASNAGVQGNITPMVILTHFGERVLESREVQALYRHNKELLVKNRYQELTKILEEVTRQISEIATGINCDALSQACSDNLEKFMCYMRDKAAHGLDSFIEDIAGADYTLPAPLIQGSKDHILTTAFDVILQNIDTNAQGIQPPLNLATLSRTYNVGLKILQDCYEAFVGAKTSILEASNLALRLGSKITIDEKALKVYCIAQLLHQKFHTVRQEYYHNHDPVSLSLDGPFADLPKSTHIFAQTLLIHRASAFSMADGRVGSEIYPIKHRFQHHNSSFTYAATDLSITELSKLNCTGSKTSLVPGIKSYSKISATLKKMTHEHSNPEIASSIMDIVCGKTPGIYTEETQESASKLKFLSTLAYLLFSTEVERNKSALITNAMFLDLVINCKHEMKDIVDLPMSAPGAVSISRTLSELTINALPGHRKYDHSGVKEKADSPKVSTLLDRAEQIYSEWMALKEVPEDQPSQEMAICGAIKEWFGIDVELECVGRALALDFDEVC
ncbi:MAG: hypothetical protein V4485_01135 [Pseudomonadota bacterium]